MIIRGWPPGGTAVSFVRSIAFFQSVPKPISRVAFSISRSHHANSFSASAISSSGVYGIIASDRSWISPSRPRAGPGMPLAVRLARRIRIQLQVRARDLRLGGPADEQVVDLRVPRELVEVERLQRRQPARVERDVAAAAASPAAAASATAAAGEARDDVPHLVLRQAR